MNISATLASNTNEPNIRAKTTSANSSSKTTKASAPTANSGPSTASGTNGIGPAATVTISSDARNTLRAAGVPANEIARINLKDKAAVSRAIQRARMSRGQRTGTTAKSPGANGANPANANTAARDVTPNSPARASSSPIEPSTKLEASTSTAASSASAARSAA